MIIMLIVYIDDTAYDSDVDADNVDDTGNHDGAEDYVMIIMLIVQMTQLMTVMLMQIM